MEQDGRIMKFVRFAIVKKISTLLMVVVEVLESSMTISILILSWYLMILSITRSNKQPLYPRQRCLFQKALKSRELILTLMVADLVHILQLPHTKPTTGPDTTILGSLGTVPGTIW